MRQKREQERGNSGNGSRTLCSCSPICHQSSAVPRLSAAGSLLQPPRDPHQQSRPSSSSASRPRAEREGGPKTQWKDHRGNLPVKQRATWLTQTEQTGDNNCVFQSLHLISFSWVAFQTSFSALFYSYRTFPVRFILNILIIPVFSDGRKRAVINPLRTPCHAPHGRQG